MKLCELIWELDSIRPTVSKWHKTNHQFQSHSHFKRHKKQMHILADHEPRFPSGVHDGPESVFTFGRIHSRT